MREGRATGLTLLTPCFPLLRLEKQAIFPSRGMTSGQYFFKFLSTFPSVMVVSPRYKTCDHFSTKQGYFFNVSGTLDLVTGGEFQTTAKATTALFAASFANSAFGHGPRARLPPPLFNQGNNAACPRPNMGSAGPSGRCAGRKLQQPRIS